MKQLFILFMLMFLFIKITNAQNENNVWCFGYGVGLDFNQTPPAPFRDSMDSFEGCASVSDSLGHLLFYSSGYKIWLSNGQPMPGSDSLLGNTPSGSCTQGVVIAKSLQNPNQYYHFVLDAAEIVNAGLIPCLRYSIIDLSMNNGMGAVLANQKNILIDSFLMEKMCITKGSGGDCPFYWLVTRHYDKPVYAAYKIDFDGVHAPVLSPASDFPYCAGNEMKISPNGNRIATAVPTLAHGPHTEIGTFNKYTGAIENLTGIDSAGYGLSFSPDSRMLYLAFRGIRRYDLNLLPDINNMASTSYAVAGISNNYFGGMRIGPDNKIYIRRTTGADNVLSRINNPDATDTACGFELNAIDYSILNTGFGSIGIGNDAIAFPYCAPPTNSIKEPGKITAGFRCYPNPVQDELYIEIQDRQRFEQPVVNLYDIKGTLILHRLLDKTENIINLKQLLPYLYFITITDKGRCLFRQKLVKK